MKILLGIQCLECGIEKTILYSSVATIPSNATGISAVIKEDRIVVPPGWHLNEHGDFLCPQCHSEGQDLDTIRLAKLLRLFADAIDDEPGLASDILLNTYPVLETVHKMALASDDFSSRASGIFEEAAFEFLTDPYTVFDDEEE